MKCLTSILFLVFALPAFAQTPAVVLSPAEEAKLLREHILANYTKYEYRIPMRDGIKLFTAVYVPKDDTKKYPMMLNRTPPWMLPIVMIEGVLVTSSWRLAIV